MRGEQLLLVVRQTLVVGSPPLARGTVHKQPPYCRAFGITPACAGNRPCHFTHSLTSWDHPRLRGEQLALRLLAGLVAGSPPLARGTEYCTPVSVSTYRITPACAGNRNVCRGNLTARRDHPRLRGEQAFAPVFGFFFEGSPPLARGTVIVIARWVVVSGITPACAGNRC